jgi:hypothetical protein
MGSALSTLRGRASMEVAIMGLARVFMWTADRLPAT